MKPIEIDRNFLFRAGSRWRRILCVGRSALEALGLGPSFRRKWVYYLASCKAGFATGATGNLQIVLRSALEG